MTLADQLDALMAEHKLTTAAVAERLCNLDAALLETDAYIARQIERIRIAHDDRRQDHVAMLQDLHATLVGRPVLPPIEDRYAVPSNVGGRARQIANGIASQFGNTFGGMN